MVNWFEQYYKDLFRFATKVVREKQIMCDPGDLVNDAYLTFFESGEDFDLGVCKKRIIAASFKYVDEKLRIRQAGGEMITAHATQIEYKARKITGDKSCDCCHEVKPVNAFRLYKRDGFTFLSHICWQCIFNKHKDWIRANRDGWNAYIKRWKLKSGITKKSREQRKAEAKPIQELWNRANKKRYEKEKELLTDSYIKRVLKAGKKPFTQKDIEKKRKELFEKRRQEAALIKNKVAA